MSRINHTQVGTATPVGIESAYAGRTAPTGWLLEYGQAVSRTTYSQLFDTIAPSLGTFTVTIASPAVATSSTHSLYTGDAVYLTTTGALPTGLSQNTIYYVIVVSGTTFNFATSRANAMAGTKINTSGSQSGTHTIRFCPYGLGDGSTTFNVPDRRGRVVAGRDTMGGAAAGRLTNPSTTTGGISGVNLGNAGGAETHTIVTGELAVHTHTLPSLVMFGQQSTSGLNNGVSASTSYTKVGTKADSTPSGENANAGSGVAHNNIQPTAISNYIIKAL